MNESCRGAPATVPSRPSGPRPKGVGFVKQPSRMAYGGIDAVLDDSCGNLLDLDQD
jgi:hypothetical protein